MFSKPCRFQLLPTVAVLWPPEAPFFHKTLPTQPCHPVVVAECLERRRSRRSWCSDFLGAVEEKVSVAIPSEVASVDSRESAASFSAEVPSRETGGETCGIALQSANLTNPSCSPPKKRQRLQGKQKTVADLDGVRLRSPQLSSVAPPDLSPSWGRQRRRVCHKTSPTQSCHSVVPGIPLGAVESASTAPAAPPDATLSLKLEASLNRFQAALS